MSQCSTRFPFLFIWLILLFNWIWEGSRFLRLSVGFRLQFCDDLCSKHWPMMMLIFYFSLLASRKVMRAISPSPSRLMEVKLNYKFGQKDLLCWACNKMEERQEHLLECSALKENELVDNPPNFKDIFGSTLEKMIITSRILRRKYQLFTTVNTRKGSSATKV